MVTGKAELADWLAASAAVELAGPVEQAVSESATAARTAVAWPAACGGSGVWAAARPGKTGEARDSLGQ